MELEHIEGTTKKENKALAFKRKHGYSITFSKLMAKYNCKTPEEYRALRRASKKSSLVKVVQVAQKSISKPQVSQQKKK